MHEKEAHTVRIIRRELAENKASFFQVLPVAIVHKVCLYSAYNSCNYDRLIHINIIGDPGVGVTSLVDGFYNDKFEKNPKKNHEVGHAKSYSQFKADSGSRVTQDPIPLKAVLFQDEFIKVRLLDNAWSGRGSIYCHGPRNAHASILLFDATDPKAFEKAVELLSSVQRFAQKVGRVIVVFTKADLVDEAFKESLAVTQFEEKTGLRVRFVSSLTGDNVNNMFESLIASVCAAQQADKKNQQAFAVLEKPTERNCSIS